MNGTFRAGGQPGRGFPVRNLSAHSLEQNRNPFGRSGRFLARNGLSQEGQTNVIGIQTQTKNLYTGIIIPQHSGNKNIMAGLIVTAQQWSSKNMAGAGVVRSGKGKALYPDKINNFVSEGTLTAGGAATDLDVSATVTRNANRGYIVCDGSGDFTVRLSASGTNFNTAFTLKSGDNFDLTGMDVDQIRLTPDASTSSNYRVHCW